MHTCTRNNKHDKNRLKYQKSKNIFIKTHRWRRLSSFPLRRHRRPHSNRWHRRRLIHQLALTHFHHVRRIKRRDIIILAHSHLHHAWRHRTSLPRVTTSASWRRCCRYIIVNWWESEEWMLNCRFAEHRIRCLNLSRRVPIGQTTGWWL